PFESEVAILTYAGKTELGPALQWVVQGFHQPGNTVNSLIEFRKLRQASAGDDGAHNKTAQQSHVTTSFCIRSHCLSSLNRFLSAALKSTLLTRLTFAQLRVARRVRAGLTRTRGILLPIIHRVTE